MKCKLASSANNDEEIEKKRLFPTSKMFLIMLVTKYRMDWKMILMNFLFLFFPFKEEGKVTKPQKYKTLQEREVTVFFLNKI